MERDHDNVRFALKNILSVANRRKNSALANAAGQLLALLTAMPPGKVHTADVNRQQTLDEIRFKALWLVDELMMLTNLEIREVLFPLPEIKRSTREFGTRVSSNYFAWLADDEQYTPERLMGILEDDLHMLEVAKAHLLGRFAQNEMQRKKRR